MLRIKRVYDTTELDDGKRILIDRLWPRGTNTLVYGAKDIEHNNGIILKRVIEEYIATNGD